MNKRLIPAALTAALSAAISFTAITGCELQEASESFQPVSNTASSQDPSQIIQQPAGSPQKNYNAAQSGSIPVTNAIADEEQGKADAAGAKTESSQTGSREDDTNKAIGQVEAQWDPKQPKLYNIALHDAASEIESKLGDPADEYALNDDAETVNVREYEGVAIGFDEEDKVKYVEVFDRAVTTGLSGLRVGDGADAAVKLLGKPSARSTSVLAYQAGTVLLKLDLDPEADRILSIKLFRDNESSKT